MKNKNLVLTIVAFTFAVGSAFASIFMVAQTAYAEVLDTENDTTWECKIVGSCQDAGTIDCQISVPTDAGAEVVTAKESGCSTALKHNTSNQMTGTIEYYDVR